jgi:hypothetical protein
MVADLAIKYRLPSIMDIKEFVGSGKACCLWG